MLKFNSSLQTIISNLDYESHAYIFYDCKHDFSLWKSTETKSNQLLHTDKVLVQKYSLTLHTIIHPLKDSSIF